MTENLSQSDCTNMPNPVIKRAHINVRVVYQNIIKPDTKATRNTNGLFNVHTTK